MQFTTTPPTFSKKTWKEKFFDQPHQPFFIAAIFFSFATMIGTLLSLLGKDVNFALFHSYGLLFGVFTNAFLGFLFTVIPRYCASSPIEPKEYTTLWFLYQISIILSLLGLEMVGKIVTSGVILYSVKIFYTNVRQGFNDDKKESYYLILLLFFGASVLLSEVLLQRDLASVLFYGYLLGIVFLVALRMVPNFYSGYTQKPKWDKPKYTLDISLLILLSMGIVGQFELVFLQKIVALGAIGFFGYVIFHLNIYTKTPPILSILVISYYWFYLGIIVYFIESILELYTFHLAFHIFALGFVLNLLIGFGTRVTRGHAIPPQRIETDKFTIGLFVLMQVVIVSRILGSLIYLGEYNFFMGFFHLSVSLWILLFLGWSFRYGKMLLRIA
jgi:uncharacterized protein involved in response to NO